MEALRPDYPTPTIRDVLYRHKLSAQVSPQIGGLRKRTRLDIVSDARRLFGCEPLTSVDPESIARFQAQVQRRQRDTPEQVTMGEPVTPGPPEVEGGIGSGAAHDGSVLPSPQCDTPIGELRDEAELAVHARSILPPAPTATGFALVGCLIAVLIAVVTTTYTLGAPPVALVSGAVALSGRPRSLGWLAQCWNGSGEFAHVVLRATNDLPVQMLALLVTLVFASHLFIDNGGALALRYMCCLALP